MKGEGTRKGTRGSSGSDGNRAWAEDQDKHASKTSELPSCLPVSCAGGMNKTACWWRAMSVSLQS